ncbi:MAG TPA: TcpQ domain-containing protein [Alphaproteobacteria bacterium]|nr:TcpQ domain-containing protein [Alphaproteobacteria bacterium]
MNATLPFRADSSLQTPNFVHEFEPYRVMSELGSMSRRWQLLIVLQTCALLFLAGIGADRIIVATSGARSSARMVSVHPVNVEVIPEPDIDQRDIAQVGALKPPAFLPEAPAAADLPELATQAEATIGGGPEPTIWAVGVEDKNIRTVIERWCLAGGYTLEWTASVDYPVPAAAKGHSYNGDLMAAIGGLAKNFGKLPTPISIRFDPKAGVLRVATPIVPAKH